MAKVELGHNAEIVKKQLLQASNFSVNSNGGMGGGHCDVIAIGHPSKLIESVDKNGLVNLKTVDGQEMFINLRWCDMITCVTIVKMVINDTEWNGKYGDEWRCEKTGKNITVYVNIGKEKDIEIVQNHRSGTTASYKDGAKLIYEEE